MLTPMPPCMGVMSVSLRQHLLVLPAPVLLLLPLFLPLPIPYLIPYPLILMLLLCYYRIPIRCHLWDHLLRNSQQVNPFTRKLIGIERNSQQPGQIHLLLKLSWGPPLMGKTTFSTIPTTNQFILLRCQQEILGCES